MKNMHSAKKSFLFIAYYTVIGMMIIAPLVISPMANAQYPVPMGYPMMPPQSYPMQYPPMAQPPMGVPVMPGMVPQTANPISALNLSQEQQ
ncbi:MAG: hypothetical protein OER96_03845, partial [Gammaproteobacteria bacterium]|nr:hypothetical protein [Gammaproteobacteria bacterium]